LKFKPLIQKQNSENKSLRPKAKMLAILVKLRVFLNIKPVVPSNKQHARSNNQWFFSQQSYWKT